MTHNSRSYLSHFTQPDTIVPDGAQGLDRYAYVNNNPIKYDDPTGHCALLEDDGFCLHQDKERGSYHIVHPGSGRFKNAVEVAIANFILSGDSRYLNRVPESLPLFVGAAAENACNGMGIDCGDRNRLVLAIMAAGFSVWGGAYPQAGTGPGIDNPSVPEAVQSDLGGSVPDITNEKLEHVFGNPEHNLDPLLESFDGDQEAAFTATYQEFASVAGNYSNSELADGIKVTVGEFEVTVRGTIVNGIPRIGTFFIP